MDDLISRQETIGAILAVTGNSSVRELYEHVQEHELSDMWSGGVNAAIDVIIAVPSAQPTQSNASNALKTLDCIDRQAAIELAMQYCPDDDGSCSKADRDIRELLDDLENLPSAQPFHNITMGEVLKYIDDMPEDVWQEFTACLECRGWELQSRTAKWCGSDFA